jgi:hypothetical protein
MPFDNTTVEIANKAEIAILDEMARLLARPEDWTKNRLQEVTEGGISRCLYGALFQAEHGTSSPTKNRGFGRVGLFATEAGLAVESAMNSLVPESRGAFPIADYNNHSTTTHNDILTLIARAKDTFQQGG